MIRFFLKIREPREAREPLPSIPEQPVQSLSLFVRHVVLWKCIVLVSIANCFTKICPWNGETIRGRGDGVQEFVSRVCCPYCLMPLKIRLSLQIVRLHTWQTPLTLWVTRSFRLDHAAEHVRSSTGPSLYKKGFL